MLTAHYSRIRVGLCRLSAGYLQQLRSMSARCLRRRHFAIGVGSSRSGSKPSVFALAAAEQSELRRIARGLGEAEMLERMRGQQPPARGALQVAALDQKRLDDVFDGVAWFRQRR